MSTTDGLVEVKLSVAAAALGVHRDTAWKKVEAGELVGRQDPQSRERYVRLDPDLLPPDAAAEPDSPDATAIRTGDPLAFETLKLRRELTALRRQNQTLRRRLAEPAAVRAERAEAELAELRAQLAQAHTAERFVREELEYIATRAAQTPRYPQPIPPPAPPRRRWRWLPWRRA